MNIYQMYYYNGKKFGFFIQRDSWWNTVAKVISIEGVIEGEDIPGNQPYYKNQKVTAEFYKEEHAKYCHSGNVDNISELSCPGTSAYMMFK